MSQPIEVVVEDHVPYPYPISAHPTRLNNWDVPFTGSIARLEIFLDKPASYKNFFKPAKASIIEAGETSRRQT